ncbi:TrbG/VirB9 family P-type conjugative transfer protein [Sphingomonas sp. GB1N7]|uniref:TrbG/VirB9 family P-type conjugative transfer protein n=1 Tax=Parasphingomonas caseinilytica TaxID=3096158 RepID=UPI002FCB1E64
MPGPGDPRIQTIAYDANQVVQLQAASGYQLTVEFGGERIENVAIGDSASWQVTPNKRGDHLFIKALANGVTTNMTVVTDARTYAFELSPLYGPLPNMAYTVRFTYPSAAVVTLAKPVIGEPEVGRYRLHGMRAIRPIAIDDDGAKTYIAFAPDRPLPAIFAIDALGRETLVDGAMRGEHYVLDSVRERLIFRLDKATASATRVRAKARK